ncbi:MAG TPA: histidine kinase [Pilimelia sp.]|nr:histidine kinase [Pilimelia sp.]
MLYVPAWWRTRSQAARFDLLVRASFYSNFAVAPVLAGGSVAMDFGGRAAWVVAALTGLHTGVCVLIAHAGVDHFLGRRPRPVRLVAAGGALTVAGVVAGFLAYPERTPGHPDGPATAIFLALVVSFVTALATAVRPRVALAVGAVGVAAAYALAARQGTPNPVAPTAGLALVLIFLVSLYRASMWMLGVVWELERSRRVQASLAVAEERLRFARDLHDVVGRSLSAVALKAELAAQLGRRGRAEAVDEMVAVRRIAQESLVELRAVVGGYRHADLAVELAGARSLLASAGIECRVVGDGGGLPAQVQGALGWVVREAATNVLRHSEARGCTITLAPAGGTVALTMDNDGAVQARAGDAGRVRFGSGLIGLAERVAGLGGTLTAERPRADLFRLTAQLPLGSTPAGEGGRP